MTTREKALEYTRRYLNKNYRLVLFNNRRQRATKAGKAFSVSFEEIVWPLHCPILGVELDYRPYGKGRENIANSPSIDCVQPELGYVSGNVMVISQRANAIKNSGTAAEHRKIADWIEANAPRKKS